MAAPQTLTLLEVVRVDYALPDAEYDYPSTENRTLVAQNTRA